MKNRRAFMKAGVVAAAAAGTASAQTPLPMKKVVHHRGGKKPDKPSLFSGAVSYGNLLFIAGKGYHKEGDIKVHTKAVLDGYTHLYVELFDRRKQAYESAIGDIKNRSEWGALEATNSSLATSLLSSLLGRVGGDEDKEAVAKGTSLGKANLTEMESDLCAVDGLKSSVLFKLQELSIGGEKKAPVRRVRVSEFFNRPIQTQADLDNALDLIRDALQKCIDEGAIIILE